MLAAITVALFTAAGMFCMHRWYEKKLCGLQERVARARALLERRSRLANEVAHEIKNPLTAILCSAEALDLLLSEKVDADQRAALKHMREYGDLLLRLVSDFLDLSRVEDGFMKPNPAPIEILEVVRSVVGLLKAKALERNHSIRLLHTAPQMYANVDGRHLRQILFNLVHNAIKFVPPEGEIEIVVTTEPENEFLTVLVNDNGTGLPEALIKNFHQGFTEYRFSDSAGAELSEVGPARTTENLADAKNIGVGCGIGLALSCRLAELAGGQLKASNRTQGGSSFELTLPVSAHEVKYCEEIATPTGVQPLLGLSFLVIDQDIGSRESISRLIEAWGGVVDNVAESVQALNALAEKHYDAVMIDGSVASQKDCVVTRTIKERLNDTNATLIVAGKDETSKAAVIQAGADVFIEKPLNGKLLLQSLIQSQNQH